MRRDCNSNRGNDLDSGRRRCPPPSPGPCRGSRLDSWYKTQAGRDFWFRHLTPYTHTGGGRPPTVSVTRRLKSCANSRFLITYPEYSHYRPLWPTSNLSEGIRRLASQNAGTAFPSALSKVTPQGPIRSKGSEGFAAVYKDGLNQSSRLFEHFDIKHQAERTAINNVPDQYRKAPRAP